MHADEASTRPSRAWPIIVLATTYLYFFAGSYYGVYAVGVRTSSIVLLALTFGAWFVVAWRRPEWRPASVLWPAFAVALGALTLATITSGNPRVSLDYLGYCVILVALYLMLRQLMARPTLRRRMTGLVTMLTTVLLIAYLAVVLARWITWWGLVGEFAAPPLRPFYEGLSFGNPGAVAALSVIGLIASVAHLGFGSVRSVGWLVVQTTMTVAVVVITGSRASWLAIVVTGVIGTLAVLVLPRGRAAVRDALAPRSVRLLAATGVITAIVLSVVIGPRIADRFLSGGTESERASFAAVSLRMAAEHPATGVGPGMWAPERIEFTQPPEVDYYIPHAHNLFTQTLAELGLVGVGAGVIVVAFGFVLWRRAVRDGDEARRRWAWAAAVATVYLAAHQMLDLFANLPAILFVLAVPWAWIDSTEHRALVSVRWLPALHRPALLAGAILLGVSVAWSWVAERSAMAMDDAAAATDRGAASVALEQLEEAERLDPQMPAHRLPLGLAQAATDPGAALATFSSLTSSDDLPTAWMNRAALEVRLGEVEEARASLDRGLRLGRQQPGVALAAGWLYEQLEDIGTADKWYATALVLEPRLAGDDFWQDPARAPRWSGIRDRAMDALPDAGRVALALAEDLPGVPAATLAANAGAANGVFPLVVDAWDGDPVAVDTLYAWTRAHPMDLDAIAWSARVAARTGDLDRAQRYREWADIVWGNAGAAGAEVAIETTPDRGAPHAGITSMAWGIYTYRRPTPRDQLLPELPHLVLTQ